MTEELTDAQLTEFALAEPVAARTAEQLEQAAQRFVRATQERAMRKQAPARGRRRTALLTVVLAIVVVVVAAGAALWKLGYAAGAHRAVGEGAGSIAMKPAPDALVDRVDVGPIHAARLRAGALFVGGASLAAGERFVVVTGDAEIEGARGAGGGAVYDVEAVADRLRALRVTAGEVHVRKLGAPERTLHAGETLELGVTDDAAGDRTRMNLGLAKLAAGDLAAARESFAAESAAAGSPFLEDALFWLAVTSSRARSPDAATQLQTFLARFPASKHALEAQGILGWRLLDLGDTEAARKAFLEAETSADPNVKSSARAGLDKLR